MNKYEFTGELPIRLHSGQIIATGFNRIVHGKRGAYVEFLDEQINKEVIEIPDGSEWRLNPAEKKCYYVLYNPKGEKIRIYHQKRIVDYADYIVDRWYIAANCLQGYEVVNKYDKDSNSDRT